ncbi:MAG TPA: N-acetyl-gamma-glutamyl-phosphate reductase [Actinomycetota bacterium]|nr:N-acetyl-gamma-glutamyl-phosphate reductase [Actinomycetota bacterium]
MDRSIKVAVLGASGFSGGELIRLLHDHPRFDVTFAGAKGSVGATVGASHPHLAGLPAGDLVLSEMDPDAIAVAADLVFSALPNGTSAGLAPAILDSGVALIDLAGDFRLPAASYPAWYGFEHPAPGWLDEAVYGLPELFRDRVPGAKLVANPGCFATAAVMSCAPILAAGLAEPGPVRVDAKTGVSGAGRAALESTSFGATEDSIRPYRFPAHQHTPEIERGIELATSLSVQALFVPHLVPAVRGVVTTSYLTGASGASTEDLTECLTAAYGSEPFVRVLPPGAMVDAKRTRGTNVIELQAVADPRTGTAVVVGAVDNLVKGAAGQAIQNANLLIGIEEATALPTTAVYP